MGIHIEVNTLFEEGVVFFGMTEEEVFTDAALWLCESFTDLSKVNNRITYHIEGAGYSKEEMLASFLNQILENINKYGMIFMDFFTRFFDIRGEGVETWAYGEPFMEKHILKGREVKRIRKTDGSKFRGLIASEKYRHYPICFEIEIVYKEREDDGEPNN